MKKAMLVTMVFLCLLMVGEVLAKDRVVQSQVKVYDASNQYLGNLIGILSDSVEVFIPSLMKQTIIRVNDGQIVYLNLFFESFDCTGQAYSINTGAMFIIYMNSGKYYTGVAMIPTLITANSQGSLGSCSRQYGLSDPVVPVNEITLPFTLPVALPMRLE